MNGLTYALMAYGLTAAISLAVVGLILFINRIMRDRTPTASEQE